MRIGVDTGGTFTDLVACVDAGEAGAARRLLTLKIPSTPDDPARAVLEGVRRLLVAVAAPARLVVTHGTTVATNALLERRGGPTALVTTAGFEDVLLLRRQARPRLYAMHPVVPPPLVPETLAFGLTERLGPTGETVTPLDEARLSAIAARLGELIGSGAVRSIAVSLLHSYANGDHERRVRERLAPLGVSVSLSSDVLPEHREYERTSTTVVDAYVAPVMVEYVARLDAALQYEIGDVDAALQHEIGDVDAAMQHGSPRARSRSLLVMESAGTAASAKAVMRRPVRTILSGPAAGVVGARAACARAGVTRFITLDVGGTSTDVALCDGEPALASEGEVAGHPVRVPSLAVHTVGAGGGSIAWRDEGGALRVGPRSAGASPGPACYGRGGEEPTVTDALLLLGRLGAQISTIAEVDPSKRNEHDAASGHASLPDGEEPETARRVASAMLESCPFGGMPLDAARAHAVMARLADALGVTVSRAAEGVVRLAAVAIAAAVRVISVEKGRDPRDLALCAFGGAGGLFACDVAEAVGMSRVLVPPAPGLLCAYGALAADVGGDYTRTCLVRVEPPLTRASLVAALAPLEAAAHADLEAEGVPRDRRRLAARVDLRYAGQSHEIGVPLDGEAGAPNDAPYDAVRAFHSEHARVNGWSATDRPVELVALRLAARGLSEPPPPLAIDSLAPAAPAPAATSAPTATRMAAIDARSSRGGGAIPCFERAQLPPGAVFDGPAIVREYSATTWLPAGWRARVDEDGALHVTSRQRSGSA